MARKIWKYPLSLMQDYHGVEAPEGAEFVAVAMQGEIPTVWALVDTNQPLTWRHLSIHGTGHTVPDGETYIGTVFDGAFVWHIFEVRHAND